MSDLNPAAEDGQAVENIPPPGSFLAFEKEDKLDLLSWYLVLFGFIILGLAGVCLYMQRISYRDFYLNGRVLGNYLLMLGICLYMGGRSIKYYRKYRRKRSD